MDAKNTTRFDGVARQTWANGGSLQVNEVESSSAMLAGANGGGNGHQQ